MLLDSGTLTICKIGYADDSGKTPKGKLFPLREHYYGERTVGYGRQYAAKGANEQVDMLVRIWQDRGARIGMYAVLENGEQYRIDNVQQLKDDDGLAVTDLTMRRLDDLYDIAAENEEVQ